LSFNVSYFSQANEEDAASGSTSLVVVSLQDFRALTIYPPHLDSMRDIDFTISPIDFIRLQTKFETMQKQLDKFVDAEKDLTVRIAVIERTAAHCSITPGKVEEASGTGLSSRVADLESKVAKLEAKLNKREGKIASLQSTVSELQATAKAKST